MFTFEAGDYKYIFEYDTPEELEKYINTITTNIEKIEEIRNRHFIAHKALEKEEKSPKTSEITWSDLEIKFIASKKQVNKVGVSTFKAYASTFNKLKDYFNRTKIEEIELEDYEFFREYLAEEYEIANKTINKHIVYTNMFLDFAKHRKLITANNLEGIESLKEEDKKKENFTDKDIKDIFSYDHSENFKDIFIIGAYTGMRVGEIIRLTADSLKQEEETGIYYFDIIKAKTDAGIRQVPIHKDILERVLQMKFPLINEKSENACQKAILRQLYKVIDKESTKVFHTFRGTFMSKCQNNFPDKEKILLIQEIVGHSKGKFKLTVDCYGRGFLLQLKKEIVDSVFYKFDD